MKTHFSKSIRLLLSAAAITLLISVGISGCSVNAGPSFPPPSQLSASSEATTVTVLQPGSREWTDANWGDTGL